MISPTVAIPRASRAIARLGPIPGIEATGRSIPSPLLSDPSPVILRERLGEGSGFMRVAKMRQFLGTRNFDPHPTLKISRRPLPDTEDARKELPLTPDDNPGGRGPRTSHASAHRYLRLRPSLPPSS